MKQRKNLIPAPMTVYQNFAETYRQERRISQFRKEKGHSATEDIVKHPEIQLRNKPGVKPGIPIDEVKFMGTPPIERSALFRKQTEETKPKEPSPLDLRKF